MKQHAVLYLAHDQSRGLCYHLAEVLVELQRNRSSTDPRIVVGSISGEQNPGLWNKIGAFFSKDDVCVFENKNAAIVKAAQRLLEEHERIIIHLQGVSHLKVLLPLKKRHPKRILFVYNVNSFRIGSWQRWPYAFAWYMLFRRFIDYMVFFSTFAADRFLTSPIFFKAGKAGVIPWGVSRQDQVAEYIPGANRDGQLVHSWLENVSLFKFVYLAQFNRNKGHALLINAFQPVLRRHSCVRLLLLGSGPLLERVRSLIARRGLSEQIVCPGRIERAFVPWVLRKSQVSVVFSRGETFGHTFIEPMLEGVPVLGTRVGVGQWIIQDYQTGIGISRDSPESVQKAAEYMISHQEQARAMGRNAQALVRSHLSVQRNAEAHLRLYTQLLST